MALVQSGVNAGSVITAVAQEELDWVSDLVEQGLDLGGVIDVGSVRMEATIRPLTASKPMCSLRHERRLLVPCFSTSHSPGPPSFSPELLTSRWMGLPSDWGSGRHGQL